MKLFADLYRRLDETTRTNRKIAAMVAYFRTAPPEDAIWAVRFLTGRRPRRGVATRQLMTWAAEQAAVPNWLFEASYEVVGDLAETIALLLPPPVRQSRRALHNWVEADLLPLKDMAPEERREVVLRAWTEMDTGQRFVWNKLLTGGFRVGVSQRLVVRALAAVSGVEANVIAHRLMGEWAPTAATYGRLLSSDTEDADISRPYPFYLAYPLEAPMAELGDRGQWQAEWKWDGIRGQIIKRGGQVFIWSRGEELVSHKYPEVRQAAAQLPDGTVLDGEILPWRAGGPLPFGELQRRIGRKSVGKKLLAEVPVIFLAYDLLEWDATDQRQRPLSERRGRLEQIVAGLGDSRLRISPTAAAPSWQALAELRRSARSRGVEGFMLKRLDGAYQVGRRRGGWWKWKIDPLTVDAVLLYAQRGHGRRAGLFTDYTFAVRDGEKLVPFAKAYSGLTDAEIREVDRFIQRNTIDRFGPVRSVRPELVFEIGFDSIRPSTRHKSGVAVRFPRILRWRRDKRPRDADTRETLAALMSATGRMAATFPQ
ncbi:MAG: ATP-dependent DNA ligase [Desulfosarcinaceae bacterium]|nr:ATP-dependent DNA ligase [Desulfosarcinaceae bacterium]